MFSAVTILILVWLPLSPPPHSLSFVLAEDGIPEFLYFLPISPLPSKHYSFPSPIQRRNDHIFHFHCLSRNSTKGLWLGRGPALRGWSHNTLSHPQLGYGHWLSTLRAFLVQQDESTERSSSSSPSPPSCPAVTTQSSICSGRQTAPIPCLHASTDGKTIHVSNPHYPSLGQISSLVLRHWYLARTKNPVTAPRPP